MYTIKTTQGNTYQCDDGGVVVTRTIGLQSLDADFQWVIQGLAVHHGDRDLVSLQDAANGADIGQGWVHVIDHGVPRIWGGVERAESVTQVAGQ